MLASYDLQIDQYTDFTRTAVIPAALLRYPLTSATGSTLMVRANPGDASPLLSITAVLSTYGQLTIMPLGNPLAMQVTILKAGVALLTAGVRLGYDWLINWSDGTTDYFASGVCFVKPGSDH
jgi:hypothetical protein